MKTKRFNQKKYAAIAYIGACEFHSRSAVEQMIRKNVSLVGLVPGADWLIMFT